MKFDKDLLLGEIVYHLSADALKALKEILMAPVIGTVVFPNGRTLPGGRPKKEAQMIGEIAEFVVKDCLKNNGFEVIDARYDYLFIGMEGWGFCDIQTKRKDVRFDIEVKYGNSKLEHYNFSSIVYSKRRGNSVRIARVHGELNENRWTIRWKPASVSNLQSKRIEERDRLHEEWRALHLAGDFFGFIKMEL